MKNGDVIDGDFSTINRTDVVVSSILLGIVTYNRSDVRGCFLHPVQAVPSNYEIRLNDGSSVNASGISGDGTSAVVTDASGLNIDVATDEIAQVRAGTAQVQNLATADWKATVPPAPAAGNAPATNAPAAPPPPSADSAAQTWEGPNQEQIIEVPTGASVDFPLNGKFRAMGVRVALSSDSPAAATATIRILGGGQELARTPPFKAGEQPRYMQISLPNVRDVTLEADSIVINAKVLLMDPVAIRAK